VSQAQAQTRPALHPLPPPPRGWWIPRRWGQAAAALVLALVGLCAWLGWTKLFPGPPPQVTLARQAAGLEVDQLQWQTLALLPIQQMQQGQHLSAGALAQTEAGPDRAWLGQLRAQRWPSSAAPAARRLQALLQHQLDQLQTWVRSGRPASPQQLQDLAKFVRQEVDAWEALAAQLSPSQLLPEPLLPLPHPTTSLPAHLPPPPRGAPGS